MTPLALGALAASATLLALPSLGPLPAPSAPAYPTQQRSVTQKEPEPGPGSGVWPVPLTQPVLTPFDDPLPYAPGHRGVDLAAAVGQPVVASLSGRVTVAGPIAGRPLVVIEHPDNVRTTYLPVEPIVRVGDQVDRGETIGTVAATGPGGLGASGWAGYHCVVTCLHWGARRGEHYIDPESLVSRESGPIVLLPEP